MEREMEVGKEFIFTTESVYENIEQDEYAVDMDWICEAFARKNDLSLVLYDTFPRPIDSISMHVVWWNKYSRVCVMPTR